MEHFPSTSPARTLDGNDVYKALRGASITFVSSAGLLVLIGLFNTLTGCQNTPETCPVDLGPYGTVILPSLISAVGTVIELVRRWRTDHTA